MSNEAQDRARRRSVARRKSVSQARDGSYCGMNGHLLRAETKSGTSPRLSVASLTPTIFLGKAARNSSIVRPLPQVKPGPVTNITNKSPEKPKISFASQKENTDAFNKTELWDEAYRALRDEQAAYDLEELRKESIRNASKVEKIKQQNVIVRFFQHELPEMFARLLILPHYRFARYWELFIVLCVFWNAVFLPFNLAFGKEFEHVPFWLNFINGFTDWLFITDLCLNFFTAYIDDWGTLITDKRMISRTYFSKWFWVDLPACFPFELFVPSSSATAIDMVKCVRLLRIAKIFKFMERFRFANSARIMRLFVSLLLICHWIGCLWYFIGVNAGTNCEDWPGYFDTAVNDVKIGDEWLFLGMPIIDYNNGTAPAFCSWLSINRLAEKDTKSKYIRSLYWAVTTITSVGYGDIVPVTDEETLFTILIMLLGAGIYAMIFSNFVSYVARMDGSVTKYSEKMEEIRSQMRYLRLPEDVQFKVEQYFEYIWMCHKGLLDKDNYFFDELPLPLHLECSAYLHTTMLQEYVLFKGCSDSFLRGCLVRLRPQIVVPEEYIINKGDSATAIFFISRGKVEVLDGQDGKFLALLMAGDCFGEVAVLCRTSRTASVRAVDFCDLQSLGAEELKELLFMYKDDADVVTQNVLKFVAPETPKNNPLVSGKLKILDTETENTAIPKHVAGVPEEEVLASGKKMNLVGKAINPSKRYVSKNS